MAMDQETLVKINKTAEKFWLLVIVACTIATTWFILEDGWEERKQLVVLPLIAAAWHAFRRYFRKKMERH
jgi:cbb3-type cytochrome oxidase subunit 3